MLPRELVRSKIDIYFKENVVIAIKLGRSVGSFLLKILIDKALMHSNSHTYRELSCAPLF